jgi:hypothetical protein
MFCMRSVLVIGCLGLSLALLRNPPDAGAVAEPARYAAASRLTEDLTTGYAELRRAAGAERSKRLRRLRRVAAERQLLLGDLVAQDPGAVLASAVPTEFRSGLPRAVRRLVEEHVDVQGTLEVLVQMEQHVHPSGVDHSPFGAVAYLHFLDIAGGKRLQLHFAGEAPELETGTFVRVHGVRVDQAVAVDTATVEVAALKTVSGNPFGARPTAVLLVNFQDKPTQPYTLDYARNVVFQTTSNFFYENSYGQTWLVGDVFGWYTLPLKSTDCNSSAIASYAKSAATAAGVNISGYQHLIYAFPTNACSWWGLGTIGGNPSGAWIKGSLQLDVVGHEMGHNFGLYHSHALDCGADVIGSSCTVSEYGDVFDIMGSRGHFNAFQKERLGWLDYGVSPPITTAAASGTYALEPYEVAGAGTKALKVLRSVDPKTGKREWYYVEYRRPIGFDGVLSGYASLPNGVALHTGNEASSNSSNLLDLTPETASWGDSPLAFGKTYYDPAIGVTIAPIAGGTNGATVAVSFGPLACVRANPTVTLAPATQFGAAGSTGTYTVSLTNNDNAGCTASSFALAASVPDGWAPAFAATTLGGAAPGETRTTTFQATAPASAADGAYPLSVTAVNAAEPAFAGSDAASYAVLSSLAVAASTERASYTANQSVSMNAFVSAGGTPLAGAAVAFTVDPPNGTRQTLDAVTGTNGFATTTLRLNRRTDPSGSYLVTANASLASGVTGIGTTSFAVR